MYWGGLSQIAATPSPPPSTATSAAPGRSSASQSVSTAGTGTLALEVVGSALKLFLDGSLVAVARDSTFATSGTIGVRASMGATVDNFSFVTPLAATNASSTLTEDFGTSNYDTSSNTTSDSGNELGLTWTEQVGAFQPHLPDWRQSATNFAVATLDDDALADVVVSSNVSATSGTAIGLVARYSGWRHQHVLGGLVQQ